MKVTLRSNLVVFAILIALFCGTTLAEDVIVKGGDLEVPGDANVVGDLISDANIVVNADNTGQNHLVLSGCNDGGGPGSARGGSIEWRGGSAGNLKGYTFVNNNSQLVFSPTAQNHGTSDTDYAWIELDSGDASFCNGHVTIVNGAIKTPGLIESTTSVVRGVSLQTNGNIGVKDVDGDLLQLAENALTVNGSADISGNTTIGDASTDTITCTGRWIPRTVAVDPTSTATAGSLGEIVFYNDKWYGKTVADGNDTNWSALN